LSRGLTPRPSPARRLTPRLEALEDRFLLSAAVTGPGEITTTAAVNRVLLTDDGTQITVFSDNGKVGTFLEGTPLTVQTNKAGSTNFISYALQGSAAQDTVLNASLNVDFGTGNGRLTTGVLKTLPTSLVDLHNVIRDQAQISDLGQDSNVQITTTSTRGNVTNEMASGSLGLGANLSDVATGGEGNDLFFVQLSGVENTGATVTLQFTGGDGINTALVGDFQDIVGGSTTITLENQGSHAFGDQEVTYFGRLAGALNVSVDAGAGNNFMTLAFDLKVGSFGSLSAEATAGPGAARVDEIVHKDAADNPFVVATATGVGDGVKQGIFTIGDSATSVAVDNSGFDTITPVK
jgi:hypothetical protein